MDEIVKEPAWWREYVATPEKDRGIPWCKLRAGITPADTIFLERIVEQGDGRELETAAGILRDMLRGRFPAIMSRREDLARTLLAIARNGYPDGARARTAFSLLIAADREAASRLIESINFSRGFPTEYGQTVASQLAWLDTDASLGKLHDLLAAQDEPRIAIKRRTIRYVSVEELGKRWQRDHDLFTLNWLDIEWLHSIYEGYPLELVIAIMGPPQDAGRGYANYVSREGPQLGFGVGQDGKIYSWKLK